MIVNNILPINTSKRSNKKKRKLNAIDPDTASVQHQAPKRQKLDDYGQEKKIFIINSKPDIQDNHITCDIFDVKSNDCCFVSNLMTHQQEVVQWMIEKEKKLSSLHQPLNNNAHPTTCVGGILADSMGLGKTVDIIALICANMYKDNNNVLQPTLVVCPSSILVQWREEILLHTTATEEQIFVHHSKHKTTLYDLHHCSYLVVLTTYGTILSEYEKQKEKSSVLFDYTWYRIVLDEAHIIKESNNTTCKSVMALKAWSRWAATGTPFHNNIRDVQTLYEFIRVKPYDNPRWWRRNVKNKNAIDKCRKENMKNRGKEMLKLPPLYIKTIPCTFNRNESQIYKQLLHNATTEYLSGKQQFCSVLTWILRLRQVCDSTYLLPVQQQTLNLNNIRKRKTTLYVNSSKCKKAMKIIREKLKQSNNQAKFVLFSQWAKMLDVLEADLSRYGIEFCRYDGSITDMNVRNKIVQTFQKSNTCKVFLATMGTAAVGLNLVSANYMILLDACYNPFLEKQAIDRIHRIGQVNPVYVYRLYVKDTVEEEILKVQAKKKKEAKYLLTDSRNNNQLSNDILDMRCFALVNRNFKKREVHQLFKKCKKQSSVQIKF